MCEMPLEEVGGAAAWVGALEGPPTRKPEPLNAALWDSGVPSNFPGKLQVRSNFPEKLLVPSNFTELFFLSGTQVV